MVSARAPISPRHRLLALLPFVKALEKDFTEATEYGRALDVAGWEGAAHDMRHRRPRVFAVRFNSSAPGHIHLKRSLGEKVLNQTPQELFASMFLGLHKEICKACELPQIVSI